MAKKQVTQRNGFALFGVLLRDGRKFRLEMPERLLTRRKRTNERRAGDSATERCEADEHAKRQRASEQVRTETGDAHRRTNTERFECVKTALRESSIRAGHLLGEGLAQLFVLDALIAHRCEAHNTANAGEGEFEREALIISG